ncbi:MAG: hypothetical protein ABR572_04730 [Cryomorphaceae bacterium]
MWKWFNMAFPVLLAALWLVGCGQPPVESEDEKLPFSQNLLNPGDAAGIRGSQPGDSPEEVRVRETFTLNEDSDSLLVYTGQLDFDESSVSITVFYNFDEFGLFEFQFDLRPESRSGAKVLHDQLKEFLTAQYGEPKQPGTALRFTSFSPSNNVVEITLSDESTEVGTPFVSLNFLEPLDDEI